VAARIALRAEPMEAVDGPRDGNRIHGRRKLHGCERHLATARDVTNRRKPFDAKRAPEKRQTNLPKKWPRTTRNPERQRQNGGTRVFAVFPGEANRLGVGRTRELGMGDEDRGVLSESNGTGAAPPDHSDAFASRVFSSHEESVAFHDRTLRLVLTNTPCDS
jgi:hypothetical protein